MYQNLKCCFKFPVYLFNDCTVIDKKQMKRKRISFNMHGNGNPDLCDVCRSAVHCSRCYQCIPEFRNIFFHNCLTIILAHQINMFSSYISLGIFYCININKWAKKCMANWHAIDIISPNLVFILCGLRIICGECNKKKFCHILSYILNAR